MLAAVSTKAVVCRHGGLVQPGEKVEEHINVLLIHYTLLVLLLVCPVKILGST